MQLRNALVPMLVALEIFMVENKNPLNALSPIVMQFEISMFESVLQPMICPSTTLVIAGSDMDVSNVLTNASTSI